MDSSEETQPAPVTSMKRKRTKRPRMLLLPSPPPATTSLSSSSTEEEEDMANCLILLACGGCPPSKKLAIEPSSLTRNGEYQYECKTCNKSFPSFQALGGHRASHKKPKPVSPCSEDDDPLRITLGGLPTPKGPPASLPPSKVKVHECSICGVEFSSGQALGGHMRRHRPLNPPPPPAASLPATPIEVKEPKFLLDLNLPAPDDNDDNTEFFPPRPLLFSAALVHCHY